MSHPNAALNTTTVAGTQYDQVPKLLFQRKESPAADASTMHTARAVAGDALSPQRSVADVINPISPTSSPVLASAATTPAMISIAAPAGQRGSPPGVGLPCSDTR